MLQVALLLWQRLLCLQLCLVWQRLVCLQLCRAWQRHMLRGLIKAVLKLHLCLSTYLLALRCLL